MFQFIPFSLPGGSVTSSTAMEGTMRLRGLMLVCWAPIAETRITSRSASALRAVLRMRKAISG